MFEEDIEKCSKCALCKEACPLFLINPKEINVSRGKILQLKGVNLKHIKYNKKIEKSLDYCLNCGRCKNFCPSEIDVIKIFNNFKFKNLSKMKKILTAKWLFKLKTLNFLKIRKNEKEILHFFGCVSMFKNDFECCGLPYFSKGRIDIFNKIIEKNTKIIKNENVKKVIFNCATCYDTVKNYYNLDEKTKEKLVFEPFSNENPLNVPFTFHKPCHLSNEEFLKIDSKLRQNKNYIPLENQICCGFGGDFFLSHPITSYKLLKIKMKEIKKTKAKKVITACPVCRFALFIGKILTLFDK